MAQTLRETFVRQVEDYLAASGLSDRKFGELAAGDYKFVYALRRGHRHNLATVERVEGWMLENPQVEVLRSIDGRVYRMARDPSGITTCEEIR